MCNLYLNLCFCLGYESRKGSVREEEKVVMGYMWNESTQEEKGDSIKGSEVMGGSREGEVR